MEKKKWYYSTWFVILMLIMIPLVGIILMWMGKKFSMPVRIVITLIGLWVMAGYFNSALSGHYFDPTYDPQK